MNYDMIKIRINDGDYRSKYCKKSKIRLSPKYDFSKDIKDMAMERGLSKEIADHLVKHVMSIQSGILDYDNEGYIDTLDIADEMIGYTINIGANLR